MHTTFRQNLKDLKQFWLDEKTDIQVAAEARGLLAW